MNKTNIQYIDYSWNPISMRCTPIATGCKNCWHLRRCDMFKNNPKFSKELRAIYAGDAPPKLIESRLYGPLETDGKIIGTQFMGDLFLDDDEYYDQINAVFGVMHNSTNTHIVLTKRPENMKRFLDNHVYMGASWNKTNYKYSPNIWLGVSVSTQEDANRLIPILLEIPAAVRWVSVEPMLENIDLRRFFWNVCEECCGDMIVGHDGSACNCAKYSPQPGYERSKKINGLIIGCESGAKRRPCKTECIENLVQQGRNAGIPVFVKQAEINGKVVSMPEILGRVWNQYPGGNFPPIN